MRSYRPTPYVTGPRRLGRARLTGVALLVASAASLTLARPAEAGNYVVTECSSQTSFSEATWERSSPHYEARALCGSDSGLQAFHDADSTALGQWGGWIWRAPAGTVFTTVQANASLTSQAGHHGELIATRPDGTEVAFGSEHNDFRVHSTGGEFTTFQSRLRCVAPGAGQPCGRAGEDAAHAYVRGVYLRTEDRAVPQLTVTGGSLFDGEVVRGTRGLTFAAADAGSGIRKVYVEGNGALLVTDIRNCAVIAGFATALTPCPATTTESAAVPTAVSAFVTGPANTVSACVEDLALDGFPNRACEARQIWVDNACPASAVGGGTELSAGFADGSATESLVASDAAAVIRGRLTGAPAGATVCALTRVLADGEPIVVGATGLTAADGSYAIELPPGPSREVYVHYVDGDRVVARHGLLSRSSARPSLDVAPNHGVRNHDRLHFQGVLPGPLCAGRVVKVQARLGKRRWQVFRTDRADGDCAFTARYKLRATSSAKRYRFRALVPQAAGYPYERGWSRTVKVKLRRAPR
ncbi:MAG: hypothetical protein QOI10_2975 [Solirubrobacterales bacterium]|jgi:hypothetical protein|nr:hypothetical protein [Solirubrobacterales bacterium]